MKLLCFSLFDTKVGTYGAPFFMNHPAAALRAVVDLASDTQTTVGRHPADYQVHQLAEWDDGSGEFIQVFANLGSVVGMLPRPSPTLFEVKEAG